jgi:hypothetical protein
MKSYGYIPAILLTVGMGVAGSACTASMYASRGNQDVQRRAYDNGYREGAALGDDDASHRLEFSYARHNEFRDANGGYAPGDGDQDAYRQSLRRGFEAGYTESFNRTAGAFPRTGLIPAQPAPAVSLSFAAQVGNRDGLEVGRGDARVGNAYDPVRSGQYRSADHDYDRRYGSKDVFQREYRAAFERGYAEGFRATDSR